MRQLSSPAAVAVAAAPCANCGAQVAGRHFCGECGQSRAELDQSVWRLLRESVEELLNVEGRTFRTLRSLLLRPGAVTADYLRGRRMYFTPPLRLYLVASAAFFFGFLLTRSIDQAYYGYVSAGATGYADAMARVLILLLPLVALLLKLLYLHAPRPLVHHVIFSLHTGAAALLWTLALTLSAAGMKAWWGHHSASPAWLPDFVLWLYLPGLAVFVGYLLLALRRAYGSSWAGAAARASSLTIAMGLVFLLVVPRLLVLLQGGG